jgi:hypothetical protein
MQKYLDLTFVFGKVNHAKINPNKTPGWSLVSAMLLQIMPPSSIVLACELPIPSSPRTKYKEVSLLHGSTGSYRFPSTVL